MTSIFPVATRRHRSISLASQVALVRSSQTFPVEAVTSVSEANCQPAPRRSFPMPASSFTGRDTRREAGVRRTKEGRAPWPSPGLSGLWPLELAPDWLRTVRAKWHRCRPGHGGERRPPTAPHRRRARATQAPGTAQPRRRPLLIVTVQLSHVARRTDHLRSDLPVEAVPVAGATLVRGTPISQSPALKLSRRGSTCKRFPPISLRLGHCPRHPPSKTSITLVGL